VCVCVCVLVYMCCFAQVAALTDEHSIPQLYDYSPSRYESTAAVTTHTSYVHRWMVVNITAYKVMFYSCFLLFLSARVLRQCSLAFPSVSNESLAIRTVAVATNGLDMRCTRLQTTLGSSLPDSDSTSPPTHPTDPTTLVTLQSIIALRTLATVIPQITIDLFAQVQDNDNELKKRYKLHPRKIIPLPSLEEKPTHMRRYT
jgi:hypothetical protein